MPINFPNSPSPSQLYTYDNKTWEWNGTYWEVYSALTSYIISAYTVGDGFSDISGVTGGNIALKSFSGVNLTIIDNGEKLTFSASTQLTGDYLSLSGGTVTGNTIFQSGLTANTISASTYLNYPDTYVTGFTLTNDNLNLTQNKSGSYSGFSINLPYLNTSGGTINGNLNVTGSLTATTFYGNGSNLSGISRGGGTGGQIYFLNISNTQSPYYEFSPSATTTTEQSITVSTGSTQTAFIGGFMTPSSLPNITNLPAGIVTFYLHSYTSDANASFLIYCELYKRTTGGTETLLLTTDSTTVIGTSTNMYISDAYFSGVSLNTSDRLVVKVFATNTSNQARSITLLSEGTQHYSFSVTTIPSYIDTYVTGFTYSNNTFTIKQNNGQPDYTSTINSVTGFTINGGLTVTGNTSLQSLTATTISATTYQNLPITGVSSGTGISISSTGSGGFQITNTEPDQTVTITGGTNIDIIGSYPNFGINFTGSIPTQGITAVTATSGVSANTTDNSVTIINTLPDQTVTISGGTGIVTGGTYPNFTITNNDLGSSQNIFKNIQITGTTQFSAESNSSNLNFSGINLTITSAATNTLVFSAGTGGSGGGTTVTGGTYSAGTLTLDNSTGGTVSVTGFPATTSFGVTVDGSGGVITTGQKGYIRIPYGFTITSWTLIGSPSGSITFDIWRTNNAIPTVANTIIGGGGTKPSLSTATYATSSTLTNWTITGATGDVIGWNVDSCTTTTIATLQLFVTRIQ